MEKGYTHYNKYFPEMESVFAILTFGEEKAIV